jgi:hypothetical protein
MVCGELDQVAAIPAMERGRRGQGYVGGVQAKLACLLARWGTARFVRATSRSGGTGAGKWRRCRRRQCSREPWSVSGGLALRRRSSRR